MNRAAVVSNILPRSLWQDETKQDETKQDAEKQDGSELLAQAFDAKFSATTLRDLDQVVELCTKAMEAGLSETDQVQAKSLMVSALMQHGEELANQIFTVPQNTRWRIFRREAVKRLERAVELQDDLASAHLLLAKLNSMQDGNRQAASKSIEKAIELAGSDQQALAQALLVRAGLADSDQERLADLNQVIKLSPANLEAIQSRALLYLRSQDFDNALQDVRSWIELEPGNTNPFQLMIPILLQSDRLDDAFQLLNEAIEREPDSSIFYSWRARVQLNREKPDEALVDADEALKRDKDDLDARLVRATVLNDRKQYEDALVDINVVLEAQPQLPQALFLRAVINTSAKKYGDAAEDFRKLSAMNPGNELLQGQLAALLNAADRPDDAIRIYNRLLRSDENNADWLRGRGDARLSTGEHDLAIADYEKALELEPNDDGVLNNLSWVLGTTPFDQLRDGKRAVEYALKACEETNYEKAHILSTLAAAYAEIGDWENAVKFSKKSVELAEPGEQHDNLSAELDAFSQNKAWRELQIKGEKFKGDEAIERAKSTPLWQKKDDTENKSASTENDG